MPPRYGFPARFEWERTLGTYEWVKLIRGLPTTSPLLTHDRHCPRVCRDVKKGWRLGPGTLKQVAITLATFADADGTNIYPGIDTLAAAMGRARSTAAAGLAHLESAGLILCRKRSGSLGVPRWHASVYHLTTPPPELLPGVLPPETERAIYDFFQRPGTSPGDPPATDAGQQPAG